MNLIARWWDNPEASASIFIALIAGAFAVYQLYRYPAERRRRTLNAMIAQYKTSGEDRGDVLRTLPCLIELGYQAVATTILREIDAIAAVKEDVNLDRSHMMRHLHDLRRDADTWMRPYVGVCYTSAHEILTSEFKFRAFMWCIEILRDQDSWTSYGISKEAVSAARRAVDKLNDFVLEYENGTYPPRSMFGQLHRSLVVTAKALEPIIWEGRGKEGRWGRRIIRLGIAGQHFNDVNGIHRISDITWNSPVVTELVVHPALTKSIFGKEVIDPRIPANPRLLPLLRLHVRSRYWSFIGSLQLRPHYFWAYGGRRLREHKRAEKRLGPALNFAVANRRGIGAPASLNFSWTLASLPGEMNQKFKDEQLQTAGRFAWIYTRKVEQ